MAVQSGSGISCEWTSLYKHDHERIDLKRNGLSPVQYRTQPVGAA